MSPAWASASTARSASVRSRGLRSSAARAACSRWNAIARGRRAAVSGLPESPSATSRCRRWRSRLGRLSYATSRTMPWLKRQTSGRSPSCSSSSSSSSWPSASAFGSATRSSSASVNEDRANTEALRIRSRPCGERWSIRAAITAWTVGGSSAGGSGPVSAESPLPSCSSIPVVSMMKNGFPPACRAIRWACASSRPSPASRASCVESSSESVSMYRLTELPRPPPQPGWSSSSE